MPDLPWEFLATRLGRFLQLGYVYGVLAGAFLLSYVFAPSLGATPRERRDAIGRGAHALTHPGVQEIFSTILALAGLLVASYLLGHAVRTLTNRVSNFVQLVVVQYITATEGGRRWYQARLEGQPPLRRSYEGNQKMHYELRFGDKQIDFPVWLTPFLILVEALYYTVPRRSPGESVWRTLEFAYGEDALLAALARHSMRPDLVKKGQLEVYWEYCSSWLRRYAPGEAITVKATMYLTACSLLVPTWLLRDWIELYAADFPRVREVVISVTPWVILYFVCVLLSLRGTRVDPTGVFRSFMLVQLLEGSREAAQPDEEPQQVEVLRGTPESAATTRRRGRRMPATVSRRHDG